MPDLYDSTRDLKDIAALAADPESISEVLTRALESLQALVPHDLAAVLRLEGEELKVMAARGSLNNERVRAHRLALRDHPTIRRALETRRPVVLQEEDHAGAEKDPYHGLVDLPDGHSCMVVPLYSQDRALGLFLDSLPEGGFLCLGAKETIRFSQHAAAFEVFSSQDRIYRKRGG